MYIQRFIASIAFLAVCFTAKAQSVGDFQSFQSGNWNVTSTWSRWDGTTWVNPAPSTPTSADGIITILNTHTVTINASVNIDQVVINNGGIILHSSGTVTINNGTGDDVTVENGGAYQQVISTVLSFSFPTTFRIKQGGTLEGRNVTHIAYPSDATHKFIFDSASIFNFNASAGSLPIFNKTYFPDATQSIIPIFRLTNYSSLNSTGNNSPTIFNGIFEYNKASAIPLNGSGAITFRNGITGTGQVTQNGTNPFYITGYPAYIGGAGVLLLNITAGLTITDTCYAKMISNKTVNGNAATNTLTVNGTLQCDNYVLSGSASFVLSPAATLKMGSANGIVTSGASGNIQNTGTSRTFDIAANYEYNGIVPQITGSGLPSQVKTLSANNSTYSSITLTNTVNVDDSLGLQNGFFTTSNAAIINLRDTTVIGSGNSHYNTCCSITNIGWERSFVKGPLLMQISSTAKKWAPVGKISGTDTLFAPVAITKNNATGIADTVEYFATPYVDTAADAGQIRRISYIEYWKINANSSNAGDVDSKVTLSWRPKSQVGDGVPANDATALNDLIVAHYIDGGAGFQWRIDGGDVAIMPKASVSTVNYGTITTNLNNATFTSSNTSPYFTLGSKSFYNLLPLKLIQFTGHYTAGNAIQLNWLTKEEKQVTHFDVQKSTDAIHFTTIATVSASNGNGVNKYAAIDNAPVAGYNYYRLRVNEQSQKVSYTAITKVLYSKNEELKIYPNPIAEVFTLYHSQSANSAMVKIYDAAGKQVLDKKLTAGAVYTQFDMPALPNGIYHLQFINNNSKQSISFIKQ